MSWVSGGRLLPGDWARENRQLTTCVTGCCSDKKDVAGMKKGTCTSVSQEMMTIVHPLKVSACRFQPLSEFSFCQFFDNPHNTHNGSFLLVKTLKISPYILHVTLIVYWIQIVNAVSM